MKVTCSTCNTTLSILSVTPLPNGEIECGGCEIRRVVPDVDIDDARLYALTDPPPVPAVFFWLLETAERN